MRDPGVRRDRALELQVGVLVLLALAALVVFIAWLTGTRFGGDVIRFYALAPSSQGLSSGDAVVLYGVEVGSVSSVGLHEGQVLIGLEVDYDGILPSDTRARLSSPPIGATTVQLLPGASTVPLAEGDTIMSPPTIGLTERADSIGVQVSTVLARVEQMMAAETVEDFRQAARSLSASMVELQSLIESQSGNLASMISNLEQTSESLARATEGPELERSMASIDSLLERLNAASGGLDSSASSLASITRKMDTGVGSLGKLVNDEELYDRMNATLEALQAASEEVAMITRDAREQPGKYLGELKISVF
jgi:phospholipid/cholesterol/gamma-HCH transport system substrate-binding protein